MQDSRDLLDGLSGRGGSGWLRSRRSRLLGGRHKGGTLVGITAARLGDGHWDGRCLVKVRVADGAVLDGHGVSLRNMAGTRCPCRLWLVAALSNGVRYWDGTSWAQ